MIQKRITDFRVGLFVIIGLVLTMMVIFMVGGEHRLFEHYNTYYSSFRNISGLRIGAPIQVSGLKVGFVDKIHFAGNLADRNIGAAFKIKTEFQDTIREDSIATIETQGLLGDKFVYISMGTEASKVIPDDGTVPSKETTSIFSLAEKAGTIMDDIAEATGAVSDMLGNVKDKKGEGDLRVITASVRKTIEQIEKGKGLAHAFIYDPEGGKAFDDFAHTIKAVKDIAIGAEKGSEGNVGGMITNLRAASNDLKNIMDSIKRGEGTLGKLINDPSVYDDLRALVGRANRNKLLRAVIRQTISENDKQVLK